MAERLLIRGGTVTDVRGERRADVLIVDGVIEAVEPGLVGDTILDAGGCWVGPGFVDLHTHLREPGHEQAGTVMGTSREAALGGFTAVLASSDTDPAVDTAAVAREIQRLAIDALCDVEVLGAITVGRAAEQLSPMGELYDLGIRVFSDGGRPIGNDLLMRRAMEYASGLGATLSVHSSSPSLAAGGHMHEGPVSSRLGIPGIPAEAEELLVMRDIALCRLTGAKIHFEQLSTGASVGMAHAAAAQGLPVTIAVTPHHLALTDAAVASYDSAFKTDPPLRPAADVAQLRLALIDGAIDAVVTHHAPFARHEKEQPFDEAPFGVPGLRTALGVLIGEVGLSACRLFEVLSAAPAAIAGISDRHGGPVVAGRPANLAVIDPSQTWKVGPETLGPPAVASPFNGRVLRGRVRHTVVGGEAVVVDGEAQR